jgi:hypothetical protein
MPVACNAALDVRWESIRQPVGHLGESARRSAEWQDPAHGVPPPRSVGAARVGVRAGHDDVRRARPARMTPGSRAGICSPRARRACAASASITSTSTRCTSGTALRRCVSCSIFNSVFTDNRAIGRGANPARAGTPGGGSGGAIYTDGNDFRVLLAGTTITRNDAREGGGGVSSSVTTAAASSRSARRPCATTGATASRQTQASSSSAAIRSSSTRS